MRPSHYRYPMRLSPEQRTLLETIIHTSRTPVRHYVVARVLLMSDQSQGEPEATDGQIAEALDISRRTVIRIKQRFVQENLGVARTFSFPRERPERRCLDGKGEAHLIHLACSQAPDGRQRWTLELLAEQMVKLEYVEHISPETVRKTLKKTNSSRGSKNRGASRKKPVGILSTTWRMCWMSIASPMTQPFPGSVWMRWGRIWSRQVSPRTRLRPDKWRGKTTATKKKAAPTCSLPMNRKPGKRTLKVTEQRTKKDWALFMQEVLVLQRDFTSVTPPSGRGAACDGSHRQCACGAADK